MHALDYAVAFEGVNGLAGDLLPLAVAHDDVSRVAAFDLCLDRIVDVAVGVAGEHYGLSPARDVGRYTLYENGRAEHRAVENAAYSAVGALPHLFEVILLYALGIGGNCCALYRDSPFFCCLGRGDGYGVVGFVALGQTQIVVFRL